MASWQLLRHGIIGILAIAAMILPLASAALAAEPTQFLSAFGPDGLESSNFDRAGAVGVDQQDGSVYVLDSGTESLYKFDEDGQPLDFGGSAPNISGNAITGIVFDTGRGKNQVAVDSQTHTIYVTGTSSLIAFDQDGEPADFTAGPGAGTNELPGLGSVYGVAVDVNGDIYVSDNASGISIFSSSGESITGFATANPGNLAVAPDGSIYANRLLSPCENNCTVLKFSPSGFPVTSLTTYAPAAESLSPIDTFGVAVSPSTANVYLIQFFPTNFGFNHALIFDGSGALVESFGEPGEDGELYHNTSGIAVNGSTEHAYVFTDNDLSGSFAKVKVFGPEPIIEDIPAIKGTAVTNVTAESALVHALINPNTALTTYYVEYGVGDCESNPCTRVPVAGAGIAAGHKFVSVSQPLIHLDPETTYHYRLVGLNKYGEATGETRTFTTQVAGATADLPDSRVWEKVSPSDKNGAILSPADAGLVQAAADGGKLAYLSLGSIEKAPDGNRLLELSF